MKRLSNAEFQARREKGLCFKCEEKYTVRHRCKAKELRAMAVQENGDELEILEEGDKVDDKNAKSAEEMDDAVKLSLNSVVGFTGLGTIKMKGKIDLEEVVVLTIVEPCTISSPNDW